MQDAVNITVYTRFNTVIRHSLCGNTCEDKRELCIHFLTKHSHIQKSFAAIETPLSFFMHGCLFLSFFMDKVCAIGHDSPVGRLETQKKGQKRDFLMQTFINQYVLKISIRG